MKKKLVTICLFFLTFYFYSNDFGLGLKNVNENRINVPRRYFEFNTTVNAGASNNYFAAEEILVEELIFDLKKIATELPYRDFMTVGLLLNGLKVKNKTKIKTLAKVLLFHFVG